MMMPQTPKTAPKPPAYGDEDEDHDVAHDVNDDDDHHNFDDEHGDGDDADDENNDDDDVDVDKRA